MDARAKDTVPWEGLTMNKCLLVASLVAFLSVGCQVVQDIIEFSENILKTELDAWMSQEGSGGELDEQWFYERWFDWSEDEEPPDVEEEEEEVLEIAEEEEEEEEGEPEFIEREEELKEEELTEQEERKKVPVSKVGFKKRQETVVKREKLSRKVWKDFHHMGNGREEEAEEAEAKKRHPRRRRYRREEEEKTQNQKEIKREDHDQRKGRSKLERDSQLHQIKPKITQRPTFSLTSKFGKPKLAERRQRD